MGAPILKDAQPFGIQGDTLENGKAVGRSELSGAYFNYAPNGNISQIGISDSSLISHRVSVPLRSQPIAINQVTNRTGSISYRVTGTIKPKQKQRKAVFQSLEEAQTQQTIWEHERLSSNSGIRPKVTILSNSELRECEAGAQMLKGTPWTLTDAFRHILAHPPHRAPDISFRKTYDDFLNTMKRHLSAAQYDSFRIRGGNFGKHIGWDTLIQNLTSIDVTNWLEGKELDNKTWNNYRNDLSSIFSWAIKEPRMWLEKNPVAAVTRFGKKALKPQSRKRLSADQCSALMQFLEENHPNWCCYFAITLFAGVRPDMKNGEMRELANCVQRDGIKPYYDNGFLNLSAEITKTGKPRQTTVHPGLAAWLSKYPPTPKNICPGDYIKYAQIRKRFEIPHDGLRHTAISAYIAKYGKISLAEQEFGNNEKIIKEHYLSRMSEEEADDFYSIVPSP